MNAKAPPNLKLLASALLVLALSGCASMSKDECLALDWRTTGYEDGAAGYSGDHIAQHRKACGKHGVTPDLQAYQSGREQGLREFCQPENGYRLGLRGAALASSCPAELKAAFQDSYDQAFELYSLRSRVANAANELEASRQALAQSERDLIVVSSLILAPDSDTTIRAQALLDAKEMAERQGRLKARIRQLEADRQAFQRDLDNYVASTGGFR
jgi:outer membrane murein-binding lipoprotein Lpp